LQCNTAGTGSGARSFDARQARHWLPGSFVLPGWVGIPLREKMNYGASWQAETSGQLFLGYTTGTRPNRERRIRHVTPQLASRIWQNRKRSSGVFKWWGLPNAATYLSLMPLAFALATSTKRAMS